MTEISSLLPLNVRKVVFGDSLTDRGDTQVSSVRSAYQNIGYTTFADLYNNSRFFQPIGGNKGVSGQGTSQMIARLGAATALNPKVVQVLAGTNDLASLSAETIANNIATICKAFIAGGVKVILITILPRFAPNAVSETDEAKRLSVNNTIKTFSSPDLIVVDAECLMNDTNLFADGLHTNSVGADKLGKRVAQELDLLIKDGRVSDILSPDNSYNNNLYFTGTSGTKLNGATGTVATDYTLDAKNIGAAVVASIENNSGVKSLVVSISGNYTSPGPSTSIELFSENTAHVPVTGDTLEGLGELEIATNDLNILGLNLTYTVLTSTYSTIASCEAFLVLDQFSNQLAEGTRYVFRTPAVVVGAGTGTRIRTYVKIVLKDNNVPTPINAIVKIHKIGTRNVPPGL